MDCLLLDKHTMYYIIYNIYCIMYVCIEWSGAGQNINNSGFDYK